ncbi:hypothetical protein [Vibrio methylphosphonaticus]|uniref:hypothetical protein n=1 Tax=Vibrio methylphosphonaticus TaxID=2946866 RepID=UPI00202A7551|nr:hypothetical protein [Vibrio methylphosphonaticus]MCL9774809.1 hypothetical protein [Vibrio methylphosphonaticus]
MKLFASLLTTVIIAGAILGAVLMQPVMAEHSSKRQASFKAEKSPTQKQVKQHSLDKNKTYVRSVVTQTISLDNVAALWAEFEDKITQQEDLPETLDRLVVIYKNMDTNFNHATVIIGFPVEASIQKDGYIKLIPSEQGEQLLNRGKNSKEEITNTWKKINFRRFVKAVVETHYLDALGQEETNQLVVHYH